MKKFCSLLLVFLLLSVPSFALYASTGASIAGSDLNRDGVVDTTDILLQYGREFLSQKHSGTASASSSSAASAPSSAWQIGFYFGYVVALLMYCLFPVLYAFRCARRSRPHPFWKRALFSFLNALFVFLFFYFIASVSGISSQISPVPPIFWGLVSLGLSSLILRFVRPVDSDVSPKKVVVVKKAIPPSEDSRF